MRTRASWFRRGLGSGLVWLGAVGASVGAHAVAFGGLGRVGWHADGVGGARHKPALVEMTVQPPKPAAPERTAAPEPPRTIRRLAVARPAHARVAAAPPSTAPAPAESAETPADFTGETLTNQSPGAGWASATGNGQRMDGPLGRPGARVTRRVVGGEPGGSAQGPPLVGLGDLSRLPAAPDLAAALESAYPAAARAKGLAGKAVVRARVMPDGRVRELALVSESASGFGQACERTLRESRWSPPYDRAGKPVSTFIDYTCRFNVE